MPNVIRVSKHGSQTPMFTLVQGDSNTKTVTFIVQRRDGAVDLSDLIWMLQIENSEGSTDTCALDAEERGSSLLMEWVCGWVAAATVGRTAIQLCGFDREGVKQWSSGKYFLDVQERLSSEPTEDEQPEMTQLQELVASSVADTQRAAEEARSAAEKAEQLADKNGWMYLDDNNGYLVYIRSSNSPADFDLNDDGYGRLVVNYGDD